MYILAEMLKRVQIYARSRSLEMKLHLIFKERMMARH